MNTYSVTVGNIGTVYTGNEREAKRVFAEYRSQSKRNYGRAAGESVTLWLGQEPVKEYVGTRESADPVKYQIEG